MGSGYPATPASKMVATRVSKKCHHYLVHDMPRESKVANDMLRYGHFIRFSFFIFKVIQSLLFRNVFAFSIQTTYLFKSNLRWHPWNIMNRQTYFLTRYHHHGGQSSVDPSKFLHRGGYFKKSSAVCTLFVWYGRYSRTRCKPRWIS